MISNPFPLSKRDRLLFFSLGLGLFVMTVTFSMILFITNDMRWILAVGSVLLFCSAVWIGSWRHGGFVGFFSLWLPIITIYWILVIPEFPTLWPHILSWISFSALGWFGFRSKRWKNPVLIITLIVTLTTFWYGAAYIPREIANSLNQFRNDPAPQFTLERLDGSSYPMQSLNGKIVLLDFFATWCAPCIAELPELEAIYYDLKDRDDVLILIVANDTGNDTPESIQAFVDERGYKLPFTFDRKGKAHTAFGFAGLPGLVIIDHSGQIRLTREGYNSAEFTFHEDIVTFLESL